MMNLMTEAAGGGASGMLVMIVYMAVIFGALYFFMVRPQKKEQKRLAAMLNDLQVGDVVVTTSGFYGVVIALEEDDCIVEFGSNRNCRIPMKRTAIAEVEKADAGSES